MRDQVLDLATAYAAEAHAPGPFVAGQTPVPVSGRVFDLDDVRTLVDASLDFWLTAGRYAKQFELDMSRYLSVKHASLCNSGSSANLLAVSALTSPKLGDRRLRPGDEVITVAAGFPTTVSAILHAGLVPVFLDVDAHTYNVDAALLDEAVGPRTRAIVLAHTLGNPFNAGEVLRVARERGLYVVEDACDALGSTYDGKLVGSLGDLGTFSFYPAHHITMGEGGCVVTGSSLLWRIVESLRDWGRDCYCDPGRDNTCGRRFAQQFGTLPDGYDHKYTYSHVGYNLKVTDMQAAVGVAQFRKLPAFIERRKRNHKRLFEGLLDLDHVLALPVATEKSDPSWFGFAVTVREGVDRRDLIRWLEDRKIATRLLFAGNILRQPGFVDVPHRVVGDLKRTDEVMRRTLWVGVYPGITDEMVDYMVDQVQGFFKGRG